MPSQDEKLRRKQILDDLAKKKKEEFEKNLPLPRHKFQLLFDFLDIELHDCDDTLKLTQEFLLSHDIANINEIIPWLQEHGGYCDCEVLANVEDYFN